MGPDWSSLFTAYGCLPFDRACLCAGRPALWKADGTQEPTSSIWVQLLGSLAGVFTDVSVSFLWTPPVVWFGLCFVILLFFFVPEAENSSSRYGHCIGGPDDSCLARESPLE